MDSISVMVAIRFIHLNRGGIIIGECVFELEPSGEMCDSVSEPLGEMFEGSRRLCKRVTWVR